MNPGWYADPHGGPDLRWWDGSSWTEHTSPPVGAAPSDTTPAPAGAAAAPAPDPWAAPVGAPARAPSGDQWAPPAAAPQQWGAPAPQAPPAGPGVPGPAGFGSGGGFPPPQQAGGGSNRTLLVVLGIGVALLLVIGGVVLLSGGDDEDTTTASTTTTALVEDTTTTTESDDTTTTTAPAGTSELVTSGAVSFARLPEPWEDWVSAGRGEIYELANTAGQFVVVQENAPSGGQWIGNLLIGDLGPSITYSGTADLPNSAQLLTNELVASYYVEGATATTILDTPIEIDGHPAHFIHTELSFAEAGLDTTNEKVVVVLDRHGREPALGVLGVDPLQPGRPQRRHGPGVPLAGRQRLTRCRRRRRRSSSGSCSRSRRRAVSRPPRGAGAARSAAGANVGDARPRAWPGRPPPVSSPSSGASRGSRLPSARLRLPPRGDLGVGVQGRHGRRRALDRAGVDPPHPLVDAGDDVTHRGLGRSFGDGGQRGVELSADLHRRRHVRQVLAPDLVAHPPHLVAGSVEVAASACRGRAGRRRRRSPCRRGSAGRSTSPT